MLLCSDRIYAHITYQIVNWVGPKFTGLLLLKDHVVKGIHQGTDYINPVIYFSILLLALVLRLNGMDWGIPNSIHPQYSYHPDEIYFLSWGKMLQYDIIIPKHFQYGGTFYYYTLLVTNWLGAFLADKIGGAPLVNIFLVGRTFGIVYALLSITLVYATGRLLFSRTSGLLAAFILAVLPAHVFWAQIIRPDELFALEYVAQLYILARILKNQGTLLANLIIGGLLLGVAVATRFPAGVIFFAYVTVIFLLLGEEFHSDRTKARKTAIRYLLILVGTSSLGYIGASPQTFLHFHEFIAGMQIQWQAQSGLFPDAVDRGPMWYQYGGRILIEALGYPFYGLVLAAIAYSLWQRRAVDLLLLSVLLPYFLMLAKTSWVVTRYTLPLMPVFALMMGSLLRDQAGRKPYLKTLVLVAIAAASLWSVILDLAYAKTLRGPDPRDSASQWLAQEAKPGARIGTFDCYRGDYFTPPPSYSLQRWEYFHLNQDGIARFLENQFDYIVINEGILVDTKRLGTKFPSLLPYNELLVWSNSSPGYSLIKTFTSSVSIAGLDLGGSFTSVDAMLARPTILVYQRNVSGVGGK